MEKQYKPVPDCEALRYKGTPGKPDIKIFVSHRIDLDAQTIDNPLYIPVRCGAVYDKRENVEMLGDDTGDNISEKRMSFNELTVQYWAWKNVKADYYGLCHYRRYHNFSGEDFLTASGEANNGCVLAENLSEETIEKFGLTENKIREYLKDADIVVHKPILVTDFGAKNNYDAMKKSPKYHNIHDVDLMLKVISEKYPEMTKIAYQYMNDTDEWLYNCYVMNAEVFNAYCEWIFDILFEVEKRINTENYTTTQYRAMGLLGEHFFGVYLQYLKKKKKYRIKETELVFIKNPQKNEIPQKITPQCNEEVVLVSNFNNNYVPVFTVFLSSVLDHISEKYSYNYIILSDDISEENKLTISKMIAPYRNFYVQYYSPKEHLQGINLFMNNSVYTIDMYYRAVVPYALKNHDKALILDVDMICMDDPAKLYFEDIENYYAGAVKDVVYQGWLNGFVSDAKAYAIDTLKLNNPYNYCNTGVLLMNLKKIRENFAEEYVRGFINTHKFRVYEQDTLNVLYQDKMKFINPRWNLFAYTNYGVKDSVNLAVYTDEQAYQVARKDPGFIHYAAHPKPWTNPECDLAVYFWQYARKSPFYELMIARMIENKTQAVAQTATMIQTPQIQQLLQMHGLAPRPQSRARDLADKLMPKGSIRRKIAKTLCPKGSPQWNLFKSIYRFFDKK